MSSSLMRCFASAPFENQGGSQIPLQSGMRKSGYRFFAEIPRLKFLESITFHDFGSTKIIVI